MSTQAATDPVKFAEFAKIARFKPSYVHQLKAEDRLVLSDDGKRVHVAASLARIAATRDPAKAAVAARHAAQRAQGGDEVGQAPQTATDAPSAPTSGQTADTDRVGNSYQAARAVKEKYLAMAAKRDYEQSIGKLLEAASVRASVADAITTLRTRLESLPDVLGPQLAAISDEARCRATLAESIEHALTELARQFKTIAPEGA